MRIRIDTIPEEGISLEFEEAPEVFPSLEEMVQAGECEFLSPIKTRLRAGRLHNMIRVQGEVESTVRLSCSRCLEEFEYPLSVKFTLTYTQELSERAFEPGEDGIELSAADMGLILFQGEEIDPQEGIQEQVVMAFPIRPLCKESCKGLCPQCGADLNTRDCICRPAPLSIQFAALKDFKAPEK